MPKQIVIVESDAPARFDVGPDARTLEIAHEFRHSLREEVLCVDFTQIPDQAMRSVAREPESRQQRKEAERRAGEPKVVAQPQQEPPLPEHCQPENAFGEGLAGREYRGGCDSTFARNHRAASKVAELRKELEANRSAIEWREAELRGDRVSNDRRKNLRNEVYDLDRHRPRIRSQLEHAEDELRRRRS